MVDAVDSAGRNVDVVAERDPATDDLENNNPFRIRREAVEVVAARDGLVLHRCHYSCHVTVVVLRTVRDDPGLFLVHRIDRVAHGCVHGFCHGFGHDFGHGFGRDFSSDVHVLCVVDY